MAELTKCVANNYFHSFPQREVIFRWVRVPGHINGSAEARLDLKGYVLVKIVEITVVSFLVLKSTFEDLKTINKKEKI